jgi:hypothetical protein
MNFGWEYSQPQKSEKLERKMGICTFGFNHFSFKKFVQEGKDRGSTHVRGGLTKCVFSAEKT